MIDIVERLRAHEPPEMSAETEDLLFDAADEIERLRAALRAARPFVDDYNGESVDPVLVLIDE